MPHEPADVYLIDGVRTPQSKYGGALAAARPDDLAARSAAQAPGYWSPSWAGSNGRAAAGAWPLCA
jgi:hypothetical protein